MYCQRFKGGNTTLSNNRQCHQFTNLHLSQTPYWTSSATHQVNLHICSGWHFVEKLKSIVVSSTSWTTLTSSLCLCMVPIQETLERIGNLCLADILSLLWQLLTTIYFPISCGTGTSMNNIDRVAMGNPMYHPPGRQFLHRKTR